MAEYPAIPLWTDAYLADTAHLTNEEHGVYLRLLMFAWRSPTCSLPDNDKRLALMVGVSPKKWQTLRGVISEFWTIEKGTWTQKRLTRERDFVTRQSEKGKAAAEARWGRKPLEINDTDDADAWREHMPNGCQTDAPTPTPTPKEEEKSSEAKASGEIADPIKAVFDAGLSVLVGRGVAPDAARRFVGKLRKDHPGQDGQILSAIMDCGKAGAVDPIPWITAVLSKPKTPSVADIMAKIAAEGRPQ